MIEITPENFVAYLQNPGQISKCYSAFHNYSTLNQYLAMCQVKLIGPLNTFKGWEKLGRHVRKGERAIELLMPIIKKEKDEKGDEHITSIFFMPRRNWFTVHQTEGDEFIPEVPGFDFSHIDEKLEVEKVEFEHPDGNCQGFAYENKYAINPVAENPMKTMFHELAHILLGHTDKQVDDTQILAKDLKEFQAESVALICAAIIGQTDELKYSLGYIQSYGVPETLDKKMIEKLFSVSNKIISACKS